MSVTELKKLIGLIIYFGLTNVSTLERYWSTKSLYHGLWARSFMSRNRFQALMSMLHVVDPTTEDESDKLRKVKGFIDKFKEKSKELYQPYQNISIDERMVKSKHRSGIRQYMKKKPTKWGIKLWVLADSTNGYTCNFDVYAGKNKQPPPSENGLGYDIVMKLSTPLLDQGYHLFFDNFYTSVKLVNDLFDKLTPSCGTTCENRRGFPESMKGGKVWGRKAQRGDMRWEREGSCLAQQWKDNKVVTILSTIDSGNDFVTASRKVKDNNVWETIEVRQPKAIETYNRFMNGVDRSDQILSKNSCLRKCIRWWKTLFFHMIDIAVVNSFILFQIYRNENADNDDLYRPDKYSVLEFREELVRQIAELEEYDVPPIYRPPKKEKGDFETTHIPKFSDAKRNCVVCYKESKTTLKVVT